MWGVTLGIVGGVMAASRMHTSRGCVPEIVFCGLLLLPTWLGEQNYMQQELGLVGLTRICHPARRAQISSILFIGAALSVKSASPLALPPCLGWASA